jgi:hypothetical protein
MQALRALIGIFDGDDLRAYILRDSEMAAFSELILQSTSTGNVPSPS